MTSESHIEPKKSRHDEKNVYTQSINRDTEIYKIQTYLFSSRYECKMTQVDF